MNGALLAKVCAKIKRNCLHCQGPPGPTKASKMWSKWITVSEEDIFVMFEIAECYVRRCMLMCQCYDDACDGDAAKGDALSIDGGK